MTLRLISLNAWGGRLVDPLRHFIRAMDPDILCLQEVTCAIDPSPDMLIFRGGGDDLIQHADLFGEVRKILPAHSAQFFPATMGELFDAEGRTFKSMFGLATFVRPCLAVLGQEVGFAHGSFDAAGGWGTPPVPRNMHCLRLLNASTGKPFTIGHLHGLRELSGKADTPARAGQAEKIISMFNRVRADCDPLILCGDLNLLPGSKTFQVLQQIGLHDLVTGRGFTDTRTSWYVKQPRFADYMLVSDAVKVTGFDVMAEPEVSDHRALLLEFE
jgi:endonuclease/exonuclease/phosphatase family metal-dependent hydrolase